MFFNNFDPFEMELWSTKVVWLNLLFKLWESKNAPVSARWNFSNFFTFSYNEVVHGLW